MKIIVTSEINVDDGFDSKRKVEKKEAITINAALILLWKLKKPRFASISFIPEDLDERRQLSSPKPQFFCKRNQRRGISVSVVSSVDETGELPALHESTYKNWRQLPTRFNKLMEQLLKDENGEDQPQTGNAYDDLDLFVERPPKLKKKKKKKAKKKVLKKPVEEQTKAEAPIVPDDDDESIFDLLDNEEE